VLKTRKSLHKNQLIGHYEIVAPGKAGRPSKCKACGEALLVERYLIFKDRVLMPKSHEVERKFVVFYCYQCMKLPQLVMQQYPRQKSTNGKLRAFTYCGYYFHTGAGDAIFYNSDEDIINLPVANLTGFSEALWMIEHEELERAIYLQGPRSTNRQSHRMMQLMDVDFC